ncbi:MAG: hypothetical protein J2P36_23540, partial [Ktedonobacteraceae bacterium]|nr:hypothetical protein [Ktedonobacteraceae bacterium]
STSQPSTPSNTVVYRGNYDPNVLTQLKNILYITPDFPGKQSVAKGLLETIKSMNDKAGSIVDVLQGSHDYEQVRRQATRIIEAVDGTAYAQSSGDLPPGRAPLLKVPVGLISSAEQPGYIDTLAQQISLLKQQSGNNNKLLQHTQNVENAIVDLNDWIQKIRVDAIQILKADNLADPAILNTARELKQLAADSYTGHVIPPNQAPEPALGSAGALQAYIESQYAAALDLQPTK